MHKNRYFLIIFVLLLVFCGESSTQENVGSVAPAEVEELNQQSQNQEENKSEKMQGENPPDRNQNPFSDPNYAECLKNEFGEERYKQLQNEQPTSDEEKRIGKCMGPPGQGPQGQGPQGQGPQGQGPQGQGPQGQPPQGQGPQGQGNMMEGELVDKAIGILEAGVSDEVLECFQVNFGGENYTRIVEELNPDEYEAGIVINCSENTSKAIEQAGGVPQEGGSDEDHFFGDPWYDLNAFNYSPTYTAATSNGNTTFGLNETADLILSGFGFNNSGGNLRLNHPVSVSSNGEKLAVTDRFNNRVLIWNTIPNMKTPADLVLGQQNFVTQEAGSGLNQFDFPAQLVITPDNKLLVADSNNDRILVWTSFPTTSGEPADYAIPITNYVDMNNSWPWGVWSNGEKTIVTATVAGTILLWDSFPSASSPPDVTITSNDIGTPRSILSNGEYIMFGDENANGDCTGPNGNRSTHVYTSWPTSSRDPDACVDNWVSGVIHENKIYSIPAGGESLYFWDNLYTTSAELKSNVDVAQPGEGARWHGGDDGGATVANGKLFIVEYNASRVSVFDSLPTSVKEEPDWSLMTDNTDDYILLEEDFIIQNPVMESDGGIFVVSSDFDSSLSVWKNLPGSSIAKPDLVLRQFEKGPWDNTFYNKSLFLAGGEMVYGWNNFQDAMNNDNYSLDLNTRTIGSVSFNSLKGIAYNGTYFALGEADTKKIYIWEGIPQVTDEPKYILDNPVKVGRMDMNDEWLVISSGSVGSSVHAIKLSELSLANFRPVPGHDDFPFGVSINEKGFFIALQGSDKVVGWSNVEDALNGQNPSMSFGGKDDKSTSGTRMASTVHWDGYHLWVGEFKFSNRLLGFAPSK